MVQARELPLQLVDLRLELAHSHFHPWRAAAAIAGVNATADLLLRDVCPPV